MTEWFKGKEVFVQDLYVGAEAAYRLPIRVITTNAWHALFVRNMFIRPTAEQLAEGHEPAFTILQLIYQQKSYEGNARDYEFSADSMHEHWKNGHEDTVSTLKRKDWLEMPPKTVGVITHDVHRENEGR